MQVQVRSAHPAAWLASSLWLVALALVWAAEPGASREPAAVRAAPSSQDSTASGKDNWLAPDAPTSATNKSSSSSASNAANKRRSGGACEYDKGAWTECQSDGVQTRLLTVKPGSGAHCEPSKTIRRDCNIGCKYARGEWSAECVDGVRVRYDTLLGERAGRRQQKKAGAHAQSHAQAPAACQPQRRVTKECRRSCHYLKSAWSECVGGFKTRNLTLDEAPIPERPGNGRAGELAGESAAKPDSGPRDPAQSGAARLVSTGAGCAKAKLIKRECRLPRNSQPEHSAGVQQQQQQRTSAPARDGLQAGQPNGAQPKLTAAQRRKLKLQLNQRQRAAAGAGPAPTISQPPATGANSNSNNNNNHPAKQPPRTAL